MRVLEYRHIAKHEETILGARYRDIKHTGAAVNKSAVGIFTVNGRKNNDRTFRALQGVNGADGHMIFALTNGNPFLAAGFGNCPHLRAERRYHADDLRQRQFINSFQRVALCDKPGGNRFRFFLIATAAAIGLLAMPGNMQIAYWRQTIVFCFLAAFRLQIALVTKRVAISDNFIKTATVFIKKHAARQFRIIVIAAAGLRNLHDATRCD